jgi:hypothetical protein
MEKVGIMATKKQIRQRERACGSPVLLAAHLRSGAGPHRPKGQRRARRGDDRQWMKELVRS